MMTGGRGRCSLTGRKRSGFPPSVVVVLCQVSLPLAYWRVAGSIDIRELATGNSVGSAFTLPVKRSEFDTPRRVKASITNVKFICKPISTFLSFSSLSFEVETQSG